MVSTGVIGPFLMENISPRSLDLVSVTWESGPGPLTGRHVPQSPRGPRKHMQPLPQVCVFSRKSPQSFPNRLLARNKVTG